MEQIHLTFLNILRSAMRGEVLRSLPEMTPKTAEALFRLAEEHRVLPLVYQAVYQAPEMGDTAAVRSKVRRLATVQTLRTAEFLELYRNLRGEGLTPMVVKGVVCRRLYPQPDLRLSGDEDILIPPEQFGEAHRVMAALGMHTQDPFDKSGELSYYRAGGPLHVELHRTLFPQTSEIYGDWNRFFSGAFARMTEIDGVFSPDHTDHMLYLLLHALKHFLHSGFGIRQVCDMVLYSEAYGSRIDWEKIDAVCRELHADVFAAALFRIGEKYLGLDPCRAGIPEHWRSGEDERALLEDLLESGVYGSATMDRRHSSGITLEAVSSDRQGKRAKPSLKSTLFPSAAQLEGRFPYLKRHPYLLPTAWLSRFAVYGSQLLAGKNAAESVKIGSRRVELMRQYRIIQ